MGRPGLTKNRKFLRLVRELAPTCKAFAEQVARGALELLWEAAYEKGDDYLGDAADVEAAAHWSGKPDVLCKALLLAGGEGEPGFIDELSDRPGHYLVHDLYDHAPGYVKKRMEREAQRIQKGKTISDVRREAAKKRHVQTAANGNHLQPNGVQTAANGTSPTPSPTPTPEKPTAAEKLASVATLVVVGQEEEPEVSPIGRETWKAYREAYRKRYGVPPVRNKPTSSKIKQFVERLGAEEAPLVAAFYVAHNGSKYVTNGHSVGLMLYDCEPLRTQWATGRQITATAARQIEKTQANKDGWSDLLKEKPDGLV